MCLPQDCWGGAWETAWGDFGERWLCSSQLTGRVAHTFTLNGCKAAPPPWLRVCLGTDPDPPRLRPQKPTEAQGQLQLCQEQRGGEVLRPWGDRGAVGQWGGITRTRCRSCAEQSSPAEKQATLLPAPGKRLGCINAAGRRAEGKPDSSLL